MPNATVKTDCKVVAVEKQELMGIRRRERAYDRVSIKGDGPLNLEAQFDLASGMARVGDSVRAAVGIIGNPRRGRSCKG